MRSLLDKDGSKLIDWRLCIAAPDKHQGQAGESRDCEIKNDEGAERSKGTERCSGPSSVVLHLQLFDTLNNLIHLLVTSDPNAYSLFTAAFSPS